VLDGLNRPLEQLFDLLGLGMIGEKLEEVVEVIDRHLEPFDRGGEVDKRKINPT
jgi:hypothetical protein